MTERLPMPASTADNWSAAGVYDLLRRIEFAGGADRDRCPACDGTGRHEDGCRLDWMLRQVGKEVLDRHVARVAPRSEAA